MKDIIYHNIPNLTIILNFNSKLSSGIIQGNVPKYLTLIISTRYV